MLQDVKEKEKMSALEADCFIRFRNYTPKDKSLGSRIPSTTVVASIERQLQECTTNAIKTFLEKDPLSQLDVKRANADLKRDLDAKLNRLSSQTNKALLELIKINLATNKFDEIARSRLIEKSIQHKIDEQNESDKDDD